MKQILNYTDFNNQMKFANDLNGQYDKQVIFHSYWNGILNEKHFYSILSCYYFNVFNNNNNNNHKIILWLENNTPNEFNKKIEKYAEIKFFSLENEVKNTNFINDYKYYSVNITFYSDYVRSLLLYNYGGCWFDLDCFFLRSFDPLFSYIGKEICVYQWATEPYPNNAVFISLEPKSDIMRKNMEFIIKRNRGWGFQQALLTFDLPLDMLVLPCSWFDAGWLINPYNIGCDYFFQNTDKKYNFDNFYKGSFCFHWHNRWNWKIEENSIMQQLLNIIESNLKDD
jgi:hypothetical protein